MLGIGKRDNATLHPGTSGKTARKRRPPNSFSYCFSYTRTRRWKKPLAFP